MHISWHDNLAWVCRWGRPGAKADAPLYVLLYVVLQLCSFIYKFIQMRLWPWFIATVLLVSSQYCFS